MTDQILFTRPQYGFAYVASPYSHPDPHVREMRYAYAAKYTAERIAAGECVYSPIVHNHHLAKTFSLRGDFAFWRDFDLSMLAYAYELRILQIDGWSESAGVTAERQFAADRNVRIVYI
jgi:hypothetical protein